MAKVSVIIPVYNSEKYIDKCIESLLSQTHDDLEIILVDDASTDRSYRLMHRQKKQNPRRIKLIKNEQNKGAGATRNVALESTTGEYITFLDSDDYLDLNALKQMHDSLEKTGLDIARINRKIVFNGHDFSFLGRKMHVAEDKIIVPSEELSYLTEEVPAVTNKMFRKTAIENRRFPEQLKWEDYPFCIPTLYTANGVVSVPNANYNYQVNTSGTTVSDARKVSPKLLDIFTASDIIREELPLDENQELKTRIDFLCIQNCLQRVRDIFYSNLPLIEKKKLISLISELINKKYGNWQENPLYIQYRNSRKLYRTRMNITEKFYIDDSYSDLDIPELEQEVEKILTKKNH